LTRHSDQPHTVSSSNGQYRSGSEEPAGEGEEGDGSVNDGDGTTLSSVPLSDKEEEEEGDDGGSGLVWLLALVATSNDGEGE